MPRRGNICAEVFNGPFRLISRWDGIQGGESQWPDAQQKMTDAMIRLERAFTPELARLTG